MDTSRGFEINTAQNGGVTVTSRGGPGYMGDLCAAFTTPADMIMWLCRQYAIPAHKILAMGGEVSTTERVGERVSESIVPVPTPYLENDGWIEWDGGECPTARFRKVEVRYRDSEAICALPLKDEAGKYSWRHVGSSVDIVAYRVVG